MNKMLRAEDTNITYTSNAWEKKKKINTLSYFAPMTVS